LIYDIDLKIGYELYNRISSVKPYKATLISIVYRISMEIQLEIYRRQSDICLSLLKYA